MHRPDRSTLRVRCPRRLHRLLVIGSSLLALTAGCARLLKPPIRVGITRDRLILPLLPPVFSPILMTEHFRLNQDLADYLDNPVSLELMKARQIRVHLGTGRQQFAIVSPGDYGEIAESDGCRMIAVPVNKQGQTYRRGLIVVASKSPINSLSEIKGKRFHFLPDGNVLNEAALGALLESGLSKDDIDKGILGLGLDTHHISSAEVAKSVILEGKVAGVIDEADYKKWAKTGGVVLVPAPVPPSPSQDQVRVLAKTVAVPNGPVLVSANTPPELTEKVRDYLLNVVPDRKLVLDPLGYTGFAEPIDPKEYEPFYAIHRELHPPEPLQPAGEGPSATEPAATAPSAE